MAYDRILESDFFKAQQQHPTWPVVISEGDSWFSHGDVIGRLDDPQDTAPANQRKWSLYRLEQGGAEIMTILSGSQRSVLRKVFERYQNLDALLFSGGGNDVIGPDLLPLLNKYSAGMTAEQCVNTARFERRLRQIMDCYRELFDMLTDARNKAKVFVNSYDYMRASGEGVTIFGLFKVAGPWIAPYMHERGIESPQLRAAIVRYMVDQFVEQIDQFAAEPGIAGRLIRVETRNAVGSSWRDEIHPSRKGAMKVANAFAAALQTAGVL